MTDTYRIRSAETWLMARDDYLSGMSAEAVCHRHDLGLSAFRRRARRYGWRRVDQADPAPADLDLSIYDDIDPDDQVETARLRFIQALNHGRSVEAIRWRRLWHELRTEMTEQDVEFFGESDPARLAARVAAARHDMDQDDITPGLDALAMTQPPALDAQVRNAALSAPEPVPAQPQGASARAGNVHDVHYVHPVFSEPGAIPPGSRNDQSARFRNSTLAAP